MTTQDQVYRLLLACGKERTAKDLCRCFVKKIKALIPYDQARVLFINKAGEISDSMLFGVTRQQWNDFMNYYWSDQMVSRFSLKVPLHLSDKEKVMTRSFWYNPNASQGDGDLFMEDYVLALRLYHSLGIGMSDQQNCIRSIITLDRTSDKSFSSKEIGLVKKIHPLVENYHINLSGENVPSDVPIITFQRKFSLTKKETEIVSLLLEGLTPTQIAQRQCISVATVYRHIANVYQKCHITNRQMLFALFSEHSSARST